MGRRERQATCGLPGVVRRSRSLVLHGRSQGSESPLPACRRKLPYTIRLDALLIFGLSPSVREGQWSARRQRGVHMGLALAAVEQALEVEGPAWRGLKNPTRTTSRPVSPSPDAAASRHPIRDSACGSLLRGAITVPCDRGAGAARRPPQARYRPATITVSELLSHLAAPCGAYASSTATLLVDGSRTRSLDTVTPIGSDPDSST